MRCPRCQADIPAPARFCADCGARLTPACPRCGAELPPGARFCPECAQPVIPRAATPAAYTPPGAYTPRHLAERILTSRESLEGERKQVTVLFADLKGSMELLANRDPEEARRLLDPILEHMMEAVHRYEGTVNQVLGDGIMALFGAPLAHEDHAVRACYAAIRMQQSVAGYVEEVGGRQALPMQIRVGVNSGEVVVRAIGSDLHMDYSAVGQTTHLAARMEQLAQPGTTLLTGLTARLVEGYVELKPLGPVPVRGLSEPVEIYELLGAGAARSRLQAAAGRGLTRFVGREGELAELGRAMERAAAGHGQLVAVVGEPGVGKSRLLHEFTRAEPMAAWTVLEGGAQSYGRSAAYLPIAGLLRAWAHLTEGEDGRRVHERLTAAVMELDASLAGTLPALLTLLDAPVEDAAWQALDPPQRRQLTLDAVRRLLVRESQRRPLCLVVEDLHWIDPQTQAALDLLVGSLPATRILLLVSYRPEYVHRWGGRSHYGQITVQPLPRDTAEALLDELAGREPDLAPLKRLLVERTEGNPFFLEESVRDLAETGALVGRRGAYRLARPVAHVQVPATVHAALAARIDRLPPVEKALLETAAVVGRVVPLSLLEAIAGLPEEDLQSALGHLRAAELLHEAALFPHAEYVFAHALTLEVAYGSLLRDRRRALHARIVDAVERLYRGRLEEQADVLAHHAVHGEVWDKAVDYLRRAGARAYTRGALLEAVERYEQALSLIPRLGDGRDGLLRALDVRLELHGPLMVLGRVPRLIEVGQEAERLARRLDDRPRLGRVLFQLGYASWLSARYAPSVACGEQALDIARVLDDARLRIRATHLLGLNRLAQGNYPAAIELLKGVLDGPDADVTRGRLSLATSYVDACGWLALALAMVGEFGAAVDYADRGVALADEIEHPQPQALAYGFRAIPPIIQGDFSLALPWCERAAHICQTRAVLAWIPTVYSHWGWALSWLGNHRDGLERLEEALAARERMSVPTHLALFQIRWAEGLLLAGRVEEARRAAERALDFALTAAERGHEALARHLLADIAAAAPAADPEAAVAEVRHASQLADHLGMRPLLGRCHLSLGGLLATLGREDEARHELAAAARLFEPMAMMFWLARARRELERIAA